MEAENTAPVLCPAFLLRPPPSIRPHPRVCVCVCLHPWTFLSPQLLLLQGHSAVLHGPHPPGSSHPPKLPSRPPVSRRPWMTPLGQHRADRPACGQPLHSGLSSDQGERAGCPAWPRTRPPSGRGQVHLGRPVCAADQLGDCVNVLGLPKQPTTHLGLRATEMSSRTVLGAGSLKSRGP